MGKNKNKIPQELTDILMTMNIPLYRINDLQWLAKNLAARNSTHPQFEKAMKILRSLLGDKMKKCDIEKIFGK